MGALHPVAARPLGPWTPLRGSLSVACGACHDGVMRYHIVAILALIGAALVTLASPARA